MPTLRPREASRMTARSIPPISSPANRCTIFAGICGASQRGRIHEIIYNRRVRFP